MALHPCRGIVDGCFRQVVPGIPPSQLLRFQRGIKQSLGLLGSRVEKSVNQFKEYIESRGTEDGAWRGEVRDSTPRRH